MNEPRINQMEYQELINSFRIKFSVLEPDQKSIEKTADDFLDAINTDSTITNDLLQLWAQKCTERGKHQLSLLFLANHIVQNSFFKKLTLHEEFFWYIREVFPSLYSLLNISFRSEIDRIVVIWEKRNIYSKDQIDEVKFLMKFETLPEIQGTPQENTILLNLITSNKLKVDDKLIEFTKAIDTLDQLGDNKHREKVLKISSEIIEKQNKTYFQHLYYLMEADKMLDKLKAYKAINENNDNNTNNINAM